MRRDIEESPELYILMISAMFVVAIFLYVMVIRN